MIELTTIKKYFSHVNKSFLFCAFLVFSVVLVMLIVANSITTTTQLQRAYYATSVDMIDQRMNSLFFEINNLPRTAGNDMVFLSNLSHLKNTIQTSGAERGDHIKYLQADFLAFLKQNTAYYKLAYIDEKGNPVVTVVSDGKDHVIVTNNQSDSDWFQKTNSLGRGEVFISKLNLNRESGQLENRGTAQNPKYVPILEYGTPVFGSDGTKRGIVVSFVYADYFLEDIRAFGRMGEKVFLIDNKGNYLAHPDKAREFAYLFGRDDSFQKDYPEVATRILSNLDKRVVESNTQVFSFHAIYPDKGSFALYKGTEKLDKNSQDSYFWILVSVTDKKYLQSSTSDLIKSAVIFAVLSLGTVAGIVAIGYGLKRGKDR